MTGPALPAPFDTLHWAASIEHGRRMVYTRQPLAGGELARNQFVTAWFEITEWNPWKGEPLHLTATRRTGESYARQGFTDTGRERLARIVLPAVTRYGFDRWWNELHRNLRVSIADCDREAGRIANVAEWWRLRADLASMHAAGDIELRGVEHDWRYPHPTTLLADTYGRCERVDIAAEAWCRGERVGWLTSRGELVPPADLLGHT